MGKGTERSGRRSCDERSIWSDYTKLSLGVSRLVPILRVHEDCLCLCSHPQCSSLEVFRFCAFSLRHFSSFCLSSSQTCALHKVQLQTRAMLQRQKWYSQCSKFAEHTHRKHSDQIEFVGWSKPVKRLWGYWFSLD